MGETLGAVASANEGGEIRRYPIRAESGLELELMQGIVEGQMDIGVTILHKVARD